MKDVPTFNEFIKAEDLDTDNLIELKVRYLNYLKKFHINYYYELIKDEEWKHLQEI